MPQKTRNIGARLATGKYIVFIENDVIVTPGWLEALVTCAEETNAAVVSPVICEGTPLHTILHFVGGEVSIRTEKTGGIEKRHLIDKINHQGQKVADVRPTLKRSETGAFEFHCVLMRRDAVEKAGYFDPVILSKELVDFTLTLKKNGEKIYLEPSALVSFMSEPPLGPPLHKDDIPFYELRWADDLEVQSLHRLRDKWALTEETFFPNRYQNIGWRRRMFVVRPFCRRLTFGMPFPAFENLCYKIESFWNRRASLKYQKELKAAEL